MSAWLKADSRGKADPKHLKVGPLATGFRRDLYSSCLVPAVRDCADVGRLAVLLCDPPFSTTRRNGYSSRGKQLIYAARVRAISTMKPRQFQVSGIT